MRPVRVAEALGVTRQAAGLWHRAWREGGVEALRSKGTGNNAYLSDEQEEELQGLLKAGRPRSAGMISLDPSAGFGR